MLTRMSEYSKNSHALLVGMQCGRATLVVSYKLKIHVAHNPAIILYLAKEIKSYSKPETST